MVSTASIRVRHFQTFLQDIKFEHSLFALPFAYLGLFLAEGGWPRLRPFLWVTIAMVGFRTFAMGMNRLIDRDVDGLNPRTRGRALPEKRLLPSYYLTTASLSLAIFFGSAWMLGPLCLALAPIPAGLAVLYPFLKRLTWLSHGVLGTLLGISSYGAWLASRPEFSWTPGVLFIGIATWVAGFDILYSLQDYEFDRGAGLRSVPVRFGPKNALRIALTLHGVSAFAWAGVGVLAHLDWVYTLGWVAVVLLLAREHWLVHRFGLERLEEAFFRMNGGVSLILFFATALDLLFNPFARFLE